MYATIERIVFATFVLLLIAFTTYVFFGGRILSASTDSVPNIVTVHDKVSGDTHYLSGTVPVPPGCTGISVDVTLEGDVAHLAFTPEYGKHKNGVCSPDTTLRTYLTSFTGGVVHAYQATVEGKSVPVEQQ